MGSGPVKSKAKLTGASEESQQPPFTSPFAPRDDRTDSLHASPTPTAMAPSAASERRRGGDGLPFVRSVQSLAANVLSHLPLPPFTPPGRAPPATKSTLANPPGGYAAVTLPLLLPPSSSSAGSSCHRITSQGASPAPPPPSAIRSFASGVRIEGLVSSSKSGGGPAFVGHVFSMLDPSGNGLMAVTTRFDIPFLSKRTPAWIKKIFATIANTDQKGPVFRFFMDLSDAVSYVKRLNVPTGMVGACRLDVAYEHFKEKPHMFQFVPNQKQVVAANKLLKQIPRKHGRRKVYGVPVFTAQNLNIAIATNDGLKWYTPYFFDKNLLDNILEASIDQHFHTLIQNRHVQRRRDVIDDNLTADAIEEYNDSLFEPPEVQEMMDEMGQYGIPLSVISKAAEIQLFDVVDKVLLGNKWLRKATGIQPKFPYMVESFEERSATSFARSSLLAPSAPNLEGSDKEGHDLRFDAREIGTDDSIPGWHARSSSQTNFKFPFQNLFRNPWSRQQQKQQNLDNQMKSNSRTEGDAMNEILSNPLLPKITMVGISMGDGQMNRAHLKKTMEDLTKELEQASHKSKLVEYMDPLFIANVGDYSGITKISSS
ncbi:hypothetical protein Cni_G17077 [Canna indica]|uniref:Tic22-like family protein n=1 Tax=Canna indica TaxID=4628 RepID=A0AAQ3QES1_9LILI|nr:hypothetical protein Cni_G17077 [Canna indica]